MICPTLILLLAPAQDLDALPKVPDGWKVSIVAKEPDLLHPGALCFDAKGRLFVGGGPQFRKPRPDTPPDSIKIVIDEDGDGRAERVKVFATGFNCIQALAWKGTDLWVANCPDVTVVRDLDGDDEADEYVRIYEGLGHLRHGLHGFNWAPDGRLYMSQGNSRVQKHAPRAFRDLHRVKSDAPDTQPVKAFKKGEYRHTYLDGWPSAEGGILRCGPMGKDLEIWARGHRNPWDITFDDGFTWLGTDNDDGPEHDRFFSPFRGAHFGMVHAWSYSWTGKDNPPTVPMSGLFPQSNGSGVGVVYTRSAQFPEKYRDVFLIGDWEDRSVYVFRPKWDGALLTHEGEVERLVTARGTKALFRPTDIEIGPDGALYVAGWGKRYGSRTAPYGGGDEKAKMNEGRVFRIWYGGAPLLRRSSWDTDKRKKPHAEWTFGELLEDLGQALPVWRVNAQDELVRRGAAVREELLEALRGGKPTKAQETWAAWALGRIGPNEAIAPFTRGGSLNLRLQAIRILGFRKAEGAAKFLSDPEPRVRFAAAQALHRPSDMLLTAAAKETDRLAFYAQWQALRRALSQDDRRGLLGDDRGGVRRAALLSLLEEDALGREEVLAMTVNADAGTAAIATLWMKKAGKGGGPARALSITPPGGDFRDPVTVNLVSGIKGAVIRYTLDGKAPTGSSPEYSKPLKLTDSVVVTAALFRKGRRFGGAVPARFHRVTEEEWRSRLRVEQIRVESGKRYRLVPDGLRVGAPAYIDRDYTYRRVPQELLGATYVMTSNEDDRPSSGAFLRFVVSRDATVYVGHDNRVRRKPEWLRRFKDTGREIETTDVPFRLYRKDFKAGTVTLGGNLSRKDDGNHSMYLVAIRPAGKKATVEGVLPLVAKADPARGRELFFGKTSCSACHRLEDRGTALGPDLADVGLRLKPREIVQSILEPNAVITEGFLQTLIQTKDGRVLSGMVREESAKALKIYGSDGRPTEVRTSEIARRKVLDSSVMPSNLATLLTAREHADLAAWLMTLKKGKK